MIVAKDKMVSEKFIIKFIEILEAFQEEGTHYP